MDSGDYYWGLYRDYYRDPFTTFPTKHQGVIAHMEPQKAVFEKNNLFGVPCFFGG